MFPVELAPALALALALEKRWFQRFPLDANLDWDRWVVLARLNRFQREHITVLGSCVDGQVLRSFQCGNFDFGSKRCLTV